MTGYQTGSPRIFKLIIRLIGSRPEAVAETYEWLATSPDVADVSGKLFAGRK